MILNIVKQYEDLLAKEFNIMEDGCVAGTITFENNSGRRKISISFDDRCLSISQNDVGNILHNINQNLTYKVSVDKDESGSIYITEEDANIFKRYDFYQLIMDKRVYSMFSINLGRGVCVNPIYFGDKQIALIKKEYISKGYACDCEIIAENENAALIAIIFASYVYDVFVSTAGEKGGNPNRKTHNKRLLSKYNPQFEEMADKIK